MNIKSKLSVKLEFTESHDNLDKLERDRKMIWTEMDYAIKSQM